MHDTCTAFHLLQPAKIEHIQECVHTRALTCAYASMRANTLTHACARTRTAMLAGGEDGTDGCTENIDVDLEKEERRIKAPVMGHI